MNWAEIPFSNIKGVCGETRPNPSPPPHSLHLAGVLSVLEVGEVGSGEIGRATHDFGQDCGGGGKDLSGQGTGGGGEGLRLE